MLISNSKDSASQFLKILVYGESGSGKTYLAKTLPLTTTLVISAESGLLSLSGAPLDYIDIAKNDKGELIPKEKRIDRLGEVYKFLQTEEAQKKYKWIFLDSLTEILQNLTEKLHLEFPDRKDSLVFWSEYAKRARGIVKAYRDLPNYNVVMTALAIVDKDDNNRRFMAIDISGRLASQLGQFFDEVFYLRVIEDEEGKIKRALLTSKTDTYMAKDRSGKLDLYEQPDLSLIANKIWGK